MMRTEDAAEMAELRGYADIDPENCWYDWQMLRRTGRKPDVDAGAKVNLVRSSDPAYPATVQAARSTLDDFRNMIPQYDAYSVLVKTKLIDEEGSAFVWLFKTRATDDGFVAQLFEIPDSIPSFRVGQEIVVSTDAVVDWMINDNGKLHGGFSLRYHRERLHPSERGAFDEHIGVTEYA